MSSVFIREYEASQLRTNLPDFQTGDTLRVSIRITEGDKERIQDFEGVCIRRKGGGIRETITVRRVSYGVGMERIFPLHSPKVDKIQIVRKGKVRRAKLYYLRDLSGKKARIVERKNPDGTAFRPDQLNRLAPKSASQEAAEARAAAAPAPEAAPAPAAEAAPEANEQA